MGRQRSAEQSAIEHGGDSAPVGGARLRPMQEVIRNSPRLKNTSRKKGGGFSFMADPPPSKDKAMANRSKDRRKSQTPKSKSNAKVEKNTREKNAVKDEDSEESNIDDRQNDDNEEDDEDMDSDDVDEESGQEEVLGEGMYEVEAIRKKRIRKVHQFLHSFTVAVQRSLPRICPAGRYEFTFLVSIRLLGFTLSSRFVFSSLGSQLFSI